MPASAIQRPFVRAPVESSTAYLHVEVAILSLGHKKEIYVGTSLQRFHFFFCFISKRDSDVVRQFRAHPYHVTKWGHPNHSGLPKNLSK